MKKSPCTPSRGVVSTHDLAFEAGLCGCPEADVQERRLRALRQRWQRALAARRRGRRDDRVAVRRRRSRRAAAVPDGCLYLLGRTQAMVSLPCVSRRGQCMLVSGVLATRSARLLDWGSDAYRF